MDDSTVGAVVAEMAPLLVGRRPGKIFQFNPHSLAIDFGLRERGYLLISTEPSAPRFYLIKRRVRDLEKASMPLTAFWLNVRKHLAGTTVTAIEKLSSERVVVMKFQGHDELGQSTVLALVLQLTGRSANVFLLNDAGVISTRSRETKGGGQTPGEKYQPPATTARKDKAAVELNRKPDQSISEALDEYFTLADAKRAAESRLTTARAELTKEISRSRKLLKKLETDLKTHANAEEQKRIGDLLLANVGTAKPAGNRVRLVDYFADDAPEIEIEIDEKLTIPEAAARRFELYSRSKRARVHISERIETVRAELAEWELKLTQLELTPAIADVSSADRTDDKGLPSNRAPTRQRTTAIPGVRRYSSTDGYEILVGRAARDNDHLTFKIAKPSDTWLHAADYPGSHVIIRNPTRKEIPHRTLLEAAQLAAHFSQANKDPKVDIHYTERKFLSKPKGAAPGLVRMSRFKSLVVAPADTLRRVL